MDLITTQDNSQPLDQTYSRPALRTPALHTASSAQLLRSHLHFRYRHLHLRRFRL